MRLWWWTLGITSLYNVPWLVGTLCHKWHGPTHPAQCPATALLKGATSPSGASGWKIPGTTTAQRSTMWGIQQRRPWISWCDVRLSVDLPMDESGFSVHCVVHFNLWVNVILDFLCPYESSSAPSLTTQPLLSGSLLTGSIVGSKGRASLVMASDFPRKIYQASLLLNGPSRQFFLLKH